MCAICSGVLPLKNRSVAVGPGATAFAAEFLGEDIGQGFDRGDFRRNGNIGFYGHSPPARGPDFLDDIFGVSGASGGRPGALCSQRRSAPTRGP